jgi:RNA polymerase sigma-70 factor (ECF subfamily)
MVSVNRLEYDPRRGAFRNWLFTVVRRRLPNWHRAQKHRRDGSNDGAPDKLLEQCPAPEESNSAWEAEWQQRAFAWACDQVRTEVSDSTWQAFWRTTVDGEPIKQTAADLGLTIAAVYLARRRVLKRLKDQVRSVQEP